MLMYQLTVPCFTQMLQSLSGQLDKGAAFAAANGVESVVLMSARLAPDMYPLSSQVRLSCTQATEFLDRLTGKPVSSLRQIETMEDAQGLIADTMSHLANADQAELDAAADRRIELVLPNGMTFDMNGMEYVRDWALPQFYFHTVTAYAILRHNGVELGKADFVRHMFAYARKSNAPR